MLYCIQEERECLFVMAGRHGVGWLWIILWIECLSWLCHCWCCLLGKTVILLSLLSLSLCLSLSLSLCLCLYLLFLSRSILTNSHSWSWWKESDHLQQLSCLYWLRHISRNSHWRHCPYNLHTLLTRQPLSPRHPHWLP
jgi:hypothetical protein